MSTEEKQNLWTINVNDFLVQWDEILTAWNDNKKRLNPTKKNKDKFNTIIQENKTFWLGFIEYITEKDTKNNLKFWEDDKLKSRNLYYNKIIEETTFKYPKNKELGLDFIQKAQQLVGKTFWGNSFMIYADKLLYVIHKYEVKENMNEDMLVFMKILLKKLILFKNGKNTGFTAMEYFFRDSHLNRLHEFAYWNYGNRGSEAKDIIRSEFIFEKEGGLTLIIPKTEKTTVQTIVTTGSFYW